MKRSTERNGRAPSPVLKAVTLLAHVARAAAPVSLAALSAAVKLPKPTAHRLAGLLREAGLVRKDPLTRCYVVGPALVDIGFDAIRGGPAHRNRQLLLERLSEKLGETVNVGVLSGGEVLYLDRVEASWPLRTDFKPGSRVPLHCTANGKLFLAFAAPAARGRLLRGLRLAPLTSRTITSRSALVAQLAEVRLRGWSEDDEEFLAGVCCLAVPIRDRRGRLIAGLAVSAPSARFTLARAREHLPDLTAAAEALGAELEAERGGGRP
ncbi:MAG: IclR family transcriptional regulator [Candidatus Rokubacteria bacterium]|nr:IclR family transcriptional regulator [Candidatus Rokubacteria bacterium]